MSQNWLGKTIAGILILGTLLLTSPAILLAESENPTSNPTSVNDFFPGTVDTTSDPTSDAFNNNDINPDSTVTIPPAGGGTTSNPAPAASQPPGGGSSDSQGSYACAVRKFSVWEVLRNLLPSNAITTFFQESVCVSIILTGLVIGNLACWIISTFIQPVFTSQDPTYKACTPDTELPPGSGPAVPPAATPPAANPPATTPPATPPATTPPAGAPGDITPIAGTLSPPGLVNNYNLLKTAASLSSTNSPSLI